MVLEQVWDSAGPPDTGNSININDSHYLSVVDMEEKAHEDGRIGGETVLVDISTQCGTMNSVGVERMEVGREICEISAKIPISSWIFKSRCNL